MPTATRPSRRPSRAPAADLSEWTTPPNIVEDIPLRGTDAACASCGTYWPFEGMFWVRAPGPRVEGNWSGLHAHCPECVTLPDHW